jgi:hypothetical protein
LAWGKFIDNSNHHHHNLDLPHEVPVGCSSSNNLNRVLATLQAPRHLPWASHQHSKEIFHQVAHGEFPALGAPAATSAFNYSHVGITTETTQIAAPPNAITESKTKEFLSNSSDKKKKRKADKTNATPVSNPASGVASFSQPLQRSSRPSYVDTTANALMEPQQHRLDGEEHQMKQLMQE